MNLGDQVNDAGSINSPQYCSDQVDRESAQHEAPEISAYCEYHGHVPSSGR